MIEDEDPRKNPYYTLAVVIVTVAFLAAAVGVVFVAYGIVRAIGGLL